jgi:hypothetical protein
MRGRVRTGTYPFPPLVQEMSLESPAKPVLDRGVRPLRRGGEHCANACLGEPDVQKMAECIRLDRGCAALCWEASAFMSRDSRFIAEVCRLCAEVCDACGAECARHKAGHCQRCAEACRRCAEECRCMAGAGVA